MDPLGGRRIQAPQEAMQGLPAPPLGHIRQPRPQLFGPLRGFEQSFQERAKVKSRPAHHNREPAAPADFRQHARGCLAVIPRCEDFAGFGHVEQVVRNAAPLRDRDFPRADVETAIDLHGIAIDDFAPQLFRESNG